MRRRGVEAWESTWEVELAEPSKGTCVEAGKVVTL